MVFLDRREGDGYVYFHAGGKPGRRKILNEGDEGWRPSFTAIPVIDFADIDSPDFDKRKALADELADAAENVGFFVAVNTPVSTELAEETFQAFEDFFALPIEEKEKVAWSKTPGARGYESFNETADKNSKQANLRESFFIGEDYTEEEQWQGPIPDGIKEQNIWPDAMPQLRVAVYMYYHKILPFARSLLHLFALALGLDETALDAEHKFPIMALRCNHYPPQKPDDLSHGFNAHADFSSFTLVRQRGQDGLQVLNHNGHWIEAPARTDGPVCNVGDYLQQLSDGRFVSTVHRVINTTGAERFSLPFFYSPDPSCMIEPVPALGRRNAQAMTYEKQTVGEHYAKRMLHARLKHPLAMRIRELGIPESDWNYTFLQGGLEKYLANKQAVAN